MSGEIIAVLAVGFALAGVILTSSRGYGRLLRYAYLDGDNFNARLIREGYAHAYRRFPFSKRQEFIQLEDQAKRREIGLWNGNGNGASHD